MHSMGPIILLVLIKAGCLAILASSESVNLFQQKWDTQLPPVILVPGVGGSQLEGKVNGSWLKHDLCSSPRSEWITMWCSPIDIAWYAERLRLVYDSSTHKTHNQPGVLTRVPGFGNTTSVDFVNPSRFSTFQYFEPIIDALETQLGYKRGITIRAVPYDFRKAPNELGDYYTAVKNLIEETFKSNGGKKIVLLGHSMGNLNMLYFLNNIPAEWKNKYIETLISIGAPYGGAVKACETLASGYNMDVFMFKPSLMRPLQRSMPSSTFLLPSSTFWSKDEVLVYSPVKNYTVSDYDQFFNDVNFTDGSAIRKDTEHLVKDLKPPGVSVHCIYGMNVSTPIAYHYKKVNLGQNWYDNQPRRIYGDGDGTVNLRSAMGCKRWIGQQKERVIIKEFGNIDHLDLIHSNEIIEYVIEILRNM